MISLTVSALGKAVSAYAAPVRGKGVRLVYARTSDAEAAAVLRPDSRLSAEPHDVQIVCASARPKHRRAVLPLLEWARELVHNEGGRLTLTAMPWLAPTYRRHGFVDDGRTASFLIRLASCCRPTASRVGSGTT